MFSSDYSPENGITYDDDLQTEIKERAEEVTVGEGYELQKHEGESVTEDFDVESALDQL